MIVVGLTGGIGAGKSTVSKLLAERGAAIVDADQIARDLQSPGSPVLDQMAERFGAQIVNEDGSLDRAGVAAIVFSDKAALDDLNGIVHPAMQAEIQRQIDLNAGTDRVVVLDFPLLGENPRKGLAATIVVDAPYELAVERVVEYRGMDEGDAQNRINSQISREETPCAGDLCRRQLRQLRQPCDSGGRALVVSCRTPACRVGESPTRTLSNSS